MEIFESANTLEPCGLANPDIFESDDVAKLGLVFIRRTEYRHVSSSCNYFKPGNMCGGKLGYVYCLFQLLQTTTRYSEADIEMKESAFPSVSFLFGFWPEM